MYFFLILFFASLFSIIIMIGRKLVMIQNGQVFHKKEMFFRTPHLEKWKYLIIEKIKKQSYVGLVGTIRFYVRFSNFLKNKYQEVEQKIKDIRKKNQSDEQSEKKEENGFLKMISEYKHKIRKIKHEIKEEENNS